MHPPNEPSEPDMTLNEIRERGHEALLRELGPEGYVRFLRQYETGKGDYTKERHGWIHKVSLDELLKRRHNE